MEFEHLKISLEEIERAISSFGYKVIGTGGFGKVYEGIVSHSKGRSMVAIKRLDRRFGQGDPEFWKEIMMLSRYTHKNLIALLGFCDEDGEKILVYEYASNRSLDRHLSSTSLTWTQRIKICLDAANGLNYLHDHKGTHQRVLHRDIKSSNILLDANWNAKISDMGLSKLGPANQQYTVLYTNVVGTPGYCDPQYMTAYTLTKESDIYSFGVVLFEVLCGRLCFESINGRLEILVPMWKQKYKQNLKAIIFQDLRPSMNSTSLETFSDIAFKCLHESREQRPTISQVVEKLRSALKFQEHHDKKLLEEKMGHQSASGRKTHEANFFSCFFKTRKGARPKDVREALHTLIHFEGSKGFTYRNLLSAVPVEVWGQNTYGTNYLVLLKGGDRVEIFRIKLLTLNKQELEIKLNLLGRIRHPNLLPLRAYYFGVVEKLLLYDYMPRGSLAAILLDASSSRKTTMDWPTRMNIAKGMARGLLSLHTYHNIIHGNLTSRKVLLDENFIPKITGFGLLQLIKADAASNLNVTDVALKYYMAPELSKLENANTKTDVYSLGVIMLELLSGKFAYNVDSPRWPVQGFVKEEWTSEVFDIDLLIYHNIEDELVNTLQLAMSCVAPAPSARPEAQSVLQQLEKIRPETAMSSYYDGGAGPSMSK